MRVWVARAPSGEQQERANGVGTNDIRRGRPLGSATGKLVVSG